MKWISLKDRIPPQDVYVLVCFFDSRKDVEMEHVEIAARLNSQWVDAANGEVITSKHSFPTHWMPIPDTPKKLEKVETIQ